jgi:hypothetical protein
MIIRVRARRERRALSSSRNRSKGRLRLALLLVALITTAGIAAGGGLLITGALRTADLTQRWKVAMAAIPPPVSTNPSQEPPVVEPRGIQGVDFALKIPRLSVYSAVASEGRGLNPFGPPAHSGGAWPGLTGDVAVDARGACFLPLSQLRPGDDVVVETLYGTYYYRVADAPPAESGTGRTISLSICSPSWIGPSRTLVAVLRAGIA